MLPRGRLVIRSGPSLTRVQNYISLSAVSSCPLGEIAMGGSQSACVIQVQALSGLRRPRSRLAQGRTRHLSLRINPSGTLPPFDLRL